MNLIGYNLEAPLFRAFGGVRYAATVDQARELVSRGLVSRVGRTRAGRVTLSCTALGKLYVHDAAAQIGWPTDRLVAAVLS